MVFQIQTGTEEMNCLVRTLISALACIVMITGCGSDDIRKGNLALELGDYELAIKFFSRCIEHNPADFDARLGIGKAYLQRAFDIKEDTIALREALMHLGAAHTIRESTSITGLLAQVWTERGTALLYTRDTLQALEALSHAIAIDQRSHEALNLAGIIYYETGRTEKARRLFERAVGADSTDISSIFNLGMVYWEEKKTAKAHALWLRALTMAPHDDDLLYWFAAAEKKIRETSSAIQSNGDSGQ